MIFDRSIIYSLYASYFIYFRMIASILGSSQVARQEQSVSQGPQTAFARMAVSSSLKDEHLQK